MITSLIFIIRKLVRWGTPFLAIAVALWLFSSYLLDDDDLLAVTGTVSPLVLKLLAFGTVFGFVGYFGVMLSTSWDKYQSDRNQIRNAVHDLNTKVAGQVKKQVGKVRERKLLTRGKAGNEPPTIYDAATKAPLEKLDETHPL